MHITIDIFANQAPLSGYGYTLTSDDERVRTRQETKPNVQGLVVMAQAEAEAEAEAEAARLAALFAELDAQAAQEPSPE